MVYCVVAGSFKASQLKEYCFLHVGDHLDETCVVRGWLTRVEPSIKSTLWFFISKTIHSYLYTWLKTFFRYKNRNTECNRKLHATLPCVHCSHTFTVFWLKKISVIVETYQLSFCVFVCAFHPNSSSFFW